MMIGSSLALWSDYLNSGGEGGGGSGGGSGGGGGGGSSGCSVSMGQKPQPSSVQKLVGSLFALGEKLGDEVYKRLHSK